MENIKSLSSDRLLFNTKSLCAEERRITVEVLNHLAEIESRRLYAELGYASLFKFAVKELKYSEGAAGRRISSMRMMRQMPDEIEEGVRSGALNVTTVLMAKRATEGRSIAEKKEVVRELLGQSQRSVEKTLARLYPEQVKTQEKERVVSEEFTRITFMADVSLMEKFEKLRGLLSHKKPNPNYQELFHLFSDELLKKLDPERQRGRTVVSLEKRTSSVTPVPAKQCAIAGPSTSATSNQSLGMTATSTITATPAARSRSRYIPRWMKREIWKRDERKCSFVAVKSGGRCGSRHFLQTDHIVPIAFGGLTEISNLRLACRAHNLYLAERMGLGRNSVN